MIRLASYCFGSSIKAGCQGDEARVCWNNLDKRFKLAQGERKEVSITGVTEMGPAEGSRDHSWISDWLEWWWSLLTG